MLCYISQPNQQFIELEIDPKQNAQVILDKVLKLLGILEVDYFGLQYKGPKNEDLWLNLRNRVCDHEIRTSCHVYKFSLRVKFFVPPHLVQQECTKELFYIQAKDAMSKGLISLAEPGCDKDTLAKIVASITQAESGDQTNNNYQKNHYVSVIKQILPDSEADSSLLDKIHSEHSKLRGVPRASARYFALKYASSLPGYGVEEHKAVNSVNEEIVFKVGPDGIIQQESKTKSVKMIPYTQIRLATHNERIVRIELMNDAGVTDREECYKLISRRAAVALYRCITEMHSFYRCDTICSDVQSQYSRDFKGTFVSIFYENSDLGKRYIFDIQRTRQEAYDHVRRMLYANTNLNNVSSFQLENKNELEKEDDVEAGTSGGNQNLDQIKHLKHQLDALKDSMLCCICMDKFVSVVLCPCGHLTCDSCSPCIDKCPQCRSSIEHLQKMYHPFGFECSKAQEV
ncbi:E3 ubiquitin-protein ligase MYLIP-like [Physella acuta]|uniref:E3 ubiquitin-protein ligase MYLIP-like n=1 Tax=Physella acuta TaxID=109671 RepID=UPI0027DC7490|nr:E3 ubiquitin-protein ligase MYLIP-like [Physella acuta]